MGSLDKLSIRKREKKCIDSYTQPFNHIENHFLCWNKSKRPIDQEVTISSSTDTEDEGGEQDGQICLEINSRYSR